MKAFIILSVLATLALGAPDGDHAHPVFVSGPSFAPVRPAPFFAQPQPQFFPQPQPQFFPQSHPQFFAPAHSPVFVSAPAPAPITAPRPTGTFVFFGRPSVRPVVAAPAPAVTTAAPETTTTAAPETTTTSAPETTTTAAPETTTTTTAAPETTTTAAPETTPAPTAAPVPAAPAPAAPVLVQPVAVDISGPANYNFQYGVNDALFGVNLGHNENRNGAAAQGQYFVTLPDGRLQTVNYLADDNGYVADVKYN